MKTILIFLLIVFSFDAFSQETQTDTYQPDSIYRVNKVKERDALDMAGSPWETRLMYDSLGRVVSWLLMRNGSQVQRMLYRYDDKGKQIAEIRKYPDGKPTMETVISHDPPSESTKYFRPDGKVESEIETWYEKPHISKRSRGTQGGQSFDYNYRNGYDKAGRLIRRECFSGKKLVQTSIYQYNNKGLLIQKSSMSDLNPPIIEYFEYIYRQ